MLKETYTLNNGVAIPKLGLGILTLHRHTAMSAE